MIAFVVVPRKGIKPNPKATWFLRRAPASTCHQTTAFPGYPPLKYARPFEKTRTAAHVF